MSALEMGVDLSNHQNVYYPTFANMRDIVDNQKISISRLYVNLDPAVHDRTALISELKNVFSDAKQVNMALVPRFFYTTGDSPPLPVIQRDMDMIISVLTSWKQQLFGVQAGFLGQSWGEWWGNGITEPDPNDRTIEAGQKKVWVADRWRQFQRDTGVVVQFRYPRDHALYSGNMAGDMAIHDDCMLSRGWDGDDSGTFSKGAHGKWNADDLTPAKEYMAKVPKFVVAEMCSDTSDFTPTCDLVLRFVQRYKVVSINKEWPSFARNIWQAGRPGASGADQQCSLAISEALRKNYAQASQAQASQAQAPQAQAPQAQAPGVSQVWQAKTPYDRGTIIIYDAKRFQCLIPHLALPGWPPSVWTQSLWRAV